MKVMKRTTGLREDLNILGSGLSYLTQRVCQGAEEQQPEI